VKELPRLAKLIAAAREAWLSFRGSGSEAHIPLRDMLKSRLVLACRPRRPLGSHKAGLLGNALLVSNTGSRSS